MLDTNQILEESGLRLTRNEIDLIRQRMPPPAPNGKIYVDGVFEGGGVRGIAFLGALRCCADVGVTWRKVAGTSAGAITAALVAADFPIAHLEKIIGSMNFMEFLTEKTSPLIFNGDPADDLGHPLWLILWLQLAGKSGQYSGEPFRRWMAGILRKQGLTDFVSLREQSTDGVKRELKVVVSDVSKGEMLVLPDDLTLMQEQLGFRDAGEFEIAEAVRLSMSIPLFFEAGKLGSSRIVDGGILSNFPLWIYDFKPGVSQQTCPRWPTFGLRLTQNNNQQGKPINGPFDMLRAMFSTMMVARDQYHLSQGKQDRVVEIDVAQANATATEFNLSDDKKRTLYRIGYKAMKQFFLGDARQQPWDWDEHLRRRGYDPVQCREEYASKS
ncbi:patatin-like phospholipase family protein [Leptolyngbya ohadii]|uniref:patatin-like phospholipase family protein n=1 Tax=Leptolyngbya ohadii TaxID=1962290 RepID=UPI000B5A1AB5|nr:patatin-like phospholipase family protein [Leptolyngbya ohadii]